jgi:hypothetical protein
MKGLLGGAAVFAAVGCASQAWADPRLDEKVYVPYVKNHVAEFEFRNGQQIGGATGGERTTILEGEYGLNDRISLAVVGDFDHEPGSGMQLNGVGLEGVIYLGQVPKLGIDTGAYLEYEHGLHGESDKFEGKLLMAKTAGRFQAVFNFIIESPIGAPAGEDATSYGYAASATWRVAGNLRIGAEAFGDLGDDDGGFMRGAQGAYVGPQLTWEGRPAGLPFDVGVDAGWLKSVGANRGEARSQARIGIELEKRF